MRGLAMVEEASQWLRGLAMVEDASQWLRRPRNG